MVMEQGSYNSFAAEETVISKLDPNGWLPYWRLKNFGDGHSALVPVYLSRTVFSSDCTSNARNAWRARQALSSFQALPHFQGMIYCMFDMRYPDVVKVGHSEKDAFLRMRQSPWRRELGRIPHKHREAEFVLACLSISSKQMETTFHEALKCYGVNLVRSFGRGREWFFIYSNSISEAVNSAVETKGEEIWIRGLAKVYDNGYRRPGVPPRYEFGGADFVIANRKK